MTKQHHNNLREAGRVLSILHLWEVSGIILLIACMQLTTGFGCQKVDVMLPGEVVINRYSQVFCSVDLLNCLVIQDYSNLVVIQPLSSANQHYNCVAWCDLASVYWVATVNNISINRY